MVITVCPPLTADIILVEAVVSLERAKGTDDKPGSFGVSILGGATTKLPAVVCEVDPQGPADLTEKVSVGSRYLESSRGG